MVRLPRVWAAVLLLALLGTVPPASSLVLTGVGITLADASAGATTTATVSFTTATDLPATARVEVTFPAGFDLSAVGAADGACSSMDGSFTTTVVGQLVRIERSGGSTQSGAESCAVADVRNPTASGLTDTFTVETYTETLGIYALADAGVAAAVTIDPATLTGTNVQPASLLAGATSTSTITFTTVNLIPSDGRIQVTYPADFDVSGATGGACSTMTGSFATSVSGQTVTLARSGGSGELAGAESCTVDGVRNPPQSGSTGTYAVRTLTSALAVIDRDAAVAADTILANALSATDAEPASLLAGATGSVGIDLTATNPVPADGVLRVTFPAGFDLSGVGAADGACSSMDGSFTTSVSGQVVTLTRSGGSAEPAGIQACSIADVRNPQVSGLAGSYAVSTLTGALAAIDQDLAVAADTLLPNVLSSVDVQPADLTAGATSTVTATFTTFNPIPADGVVEVTFPAGFDLSAVGAASGACGTMDGSLATSVSGQVVTLTRSGGTPEPAGEQSCTVADVGNPGAAGSTGTYAVKTLNSILDLIDQALAIPGDTLSVGGVTGAVASLTTAYTGRLSDITFTWTGTATIPDDGELTFTFPSGFLTDAASSATCTMDGTLALTKTASTVVLTRQADGTDELPGLRSCTIRQVQVPGTAGLTGSFNLGVETGSGASQEGGSVPGVTIAPTGGGGGGGGGSAGGPSAPDTADAGTAQDDPAASGAEENQETEPEDELDLKKDVKAPAKDVASILLHLNGDGELNVTRLAPTGVPPAGFRGTGIYFDIALTGGSLRSATISVDLPDGMDPDRAVLLHGVRGGWEPLEGTVSGGRLHAVTTSFSPFWLVEDEQAPQDIALSIDEHGVLRADWNENQRRATAHLWIDGRLVASADDAPFLQHNITGLGPGDHALSVRITDPAGHSEEYHATLSSGDGAPAVRTPDAVVQTVPGPAVPLAGAALLALAFVLRRRL